MKIAKFKEKHIFCIEGDWDKNPTKKISIKSSLDFLEQNSTIKTSHHKCSTKEEFYKRINQFLTKRNEKFSIFYFAFHGSCNGILIGKEFIDLNELGEQFERKLHNKIIHFGSCSTLKISKKQINNFLEQTNALCVSGFKKDIPFTSSTLFDALYFELCQNYKNTASIESKMKHYYENKIKELGFQMNYL
jgi:hypothetical protein